MAGGLFEGLSAKDVEGPIAELVEFKNLLLVLVEEGLVLFGDVDLLVVGGHLEVK